MIRQNKKLMYYAGGAIILGAVSFFVYNFFNKGEINIGDTNLRLGKDEQVNADEEKKANIFSDMLEQRGKDDFGINWKPLNHQTKFSLS